MRSSPPPDDQIPVEPVEPQESQIIVALQWRQISSDEARLFRYDYEEYPLPPDSGRVRGYLCRVVPQNHRYCGCLRAVPTYYFAPHPDRWVREGLHDLFPLHYRDVRASVRLFLQDRAAGQWIEDSYGVGVVTVTE